MAVATLSSGKTDGGGLVDGEIEGATICLKGPGLRVTKYPIPLTPICKDITLRFPKKDVPDSRESTLQLRFSIFEDESSAVEVELYKAGHWAWASDRFVDLPLSGPDSLICVVSWADGEPVGSFFWIKASLLALVEKREDAQIEAEALKDKAERNGDEPILSFVNHVGKGPNMQDVAQDLSELLAPIESADPDTLRHLPFSLPPIPLLLRNAGEQFLRKSKEIQSRTLLDASIGCFERILRLTHPSDQRDEYMSHLVKAVDVFLVRRARKFNDPQDLPDIQWRITRIDRIAKSSSDDSDHNHSLPPLFFFFLGHLLFWKFFISESIDDISGSVSAFQQQVGLLTPNDADYVDAVKSLCIALDIRFQRGSGNVEDLTLGIKHFMDLLQHISPNNPALRTDILTQLASLHRCRSISNTSADDATVAIQYQREAVALTPAGTPQHTEALIGLATHIECRSNMLRSVDDCNEAISICETVIQSSGPEGNPPPQHLSTLASNLAFRSTLIKSLSDISRAISLLQTTIDATPPNSFAYNSLLVCLGQAFSSRFHITFSISDYESSVTAVEKAVQAGHFNRADGLNVVGVKRKALYSLKGGVENISAAIDKLKASVDLTPKTDHRLPARLHDLAQALATRYGATGDIDDINNAISLQEQVIDLTPADSIHLGLRLAYLSSAFEERYKKEKKADDLATAISTIQKSYENMSHHPTQLQQQSFIKKQFAQLLAQRFNATRDPEDLKTALPFVSPIAEDVTINPGYRLSLSSECAIWSMWLEDKENALRYGAIAIELLAETVSLEQTVRDRYSYLLQAYIHGVSCAGIALYFNELETGLEWLEQGRCLVWSQLSQLQSPLDSLRAQRPDLATKLEATGKFLRSTGSREQSTGVLLANTLTANAREVQEHTDAAQEWHQTLEEIRKIDEFSSFLKPPNATNLLQRLPQEGVVVTFSILKYGCLALALVAGRGITKIPLEDFSAEKASELRDQLKSYLKESGMLARSATRGMSWDDGDSGAQVLSSVLADLWFYVVKPVIDALQFEPITSNNPRPRVWWCPTGPLSFLPLHAAGIYGSDDSIHGLCVSDYVVSSYSPNVTTLLNKLEENSKHTTSTNHILLVSQPDTPGQFPIPATTEETHAVQAIMQGANIPCVVLEREDATLAHVTSAMKTHSWAHIACHAVQSTEDPLKSGIHLHDGRLELLEMIKEEIPNTDHAFLSACQTSTGDEGLAEEAVHVAASMLAAGYRSVVATMWSISDNCGPTVAAMFYQHLVEEAEQRGDVTRMDSGRSAYALDHAVRQLRGEIGDEEDGLLTWVPYVHLGV